MNTELNHLDKLVIKQLKYAYDKEEFTFDLNVQKGDIVALIGQSGSGKSTLLALLAGFLPPKTGEICFNGVSLLNKAPDKRPFSFLFQSDNLFGHLTARQNIALGLSTGYRLSPAEQSAIELAAKQVGVDAYLDRLPEQLSGGQQQRVALARCFVQSKEYWLLDEPFSALDPVIRSQMLTLVKQLACAAQKTIIMVTHELTDAKRIASHFAFVDKGKIAAFGAIDELNSQHPCKALGDFVKLARVD